MSGVSPTTSNANEVNSPIPGSFGSPSGAAWGSLALILSCVVALAGSWLAADPRA